MLRMTASDTQNWLADTDPLPVVALDDPVVETHGHAPDSDYAETYWLPVVGPTALWALRRLARWLEDAPDGYPLPLGPFARELGLGDGVGRSSPVVRSLARLVTFGLAEIRGGRLMVRRSVPPLARRHLQRLPGHLVAEHQTATATTHPSAGGNVVAPTCIRRTHSRRDPRPCRRPRISKGLASTPPPAPPPLRSGL